MTGPPERPPHEALARRLRGKGVQDERVLAAIARVPRARFMPPETREHAALDQALEIGCGQTISQPYMVAVMTEESALLGGEKVLEIGTGSGYQTAILAGLAREIWTIERHSVLSLRARGVLDGLGVANVRYRIGDGSLGIPEEAPFDRILVTAGAPSMPEALFEQLAEGGVLVAPIGDERNQTLTVVEKIQGRPRIRRVMPCRFVKLVGEQGWFD